LIDEALQTGLRSRLEDMRGRLSRLEQREINKRQLVLEAMSEVGLAKLEQPDFTVSLRSGVPLSSWLLNAKCQVIFGFRRHLSSIDKLCLAS
jgi:hypothetical protein